MNKKRGRIFAVLLIVVIMLSAFSGLSFNAAEVDIAQNFAVEPSEELAEVGETVPPTEPEPTEAPTEPQPVVIVPTVKNIVKTSSLTDCIKLEWDPASRVTGYYVYCCDAEKSSEYKKVCTVTSPNCTINNLRQASKYNFRVSAYVVRNGKTYEGAKTQKMTATQPEAPKGLNKWRSSNVLRIKWDSNPRATGYRIYRKEGNGSSSLYKILKGYNNTTFDDSAVKQGRTYTYQVRCYREMNDIAYCSSIVSETFIAGMSAPDFSISSRCSRAILTWNKNPYATHYEVYYSTKPDYSSYTKLGTTTNLYYFSRNLTAKKEYYFRVRPIYKKGSTYITGTSVEKSIKISPNAYGQTLGGDYVEVNITMQRMWVYRNGKQMLSTDVVTGNYGSNDTPKGYFSIQYKERSTYLVGPGYSSYVDYWMPFYGGCGIHDASWRSSFGGTIYQGNGSHGCVNTPGSVMGKVYSYSYTGMPVIVY